MTKPPPRHRNYPHLNVTLSQSTYDALRAAAAERDISVSQMVDAAIVVYLARTSVSACDETCGNNPIRIHP